MKRTAIVYDFDNTLAKGNLQEKSFIPDIGMEREAFWKAVGDETKSHDADGILLYMYYMLEKAKAQNISVTRELLKQHGTYADLFPGLEDGKWFSRINQFGQKNDLEIEHYIISSGIDEMILGCPIHKYFKHVFASKFIYNENGEAVWPGVGINYTTKTQYLYRINKGIINHWDGKSINDFVAYDKRPIPFDHMIFIGDGYTDIPAMKMLNSKGGYSVAVYNLEESQSDNLETIHNLLSDERANFVAPADYRENTTLDIIVKGILGRIAKL